MSLYEYVTSLHAHTRYLIPKPGQTRGLQVYQVPGTWYTSNYHSRYHHQQLVSPTTYIRTRYLIPVCWETDTSNYTGFSPSKLMPVITIYGVHDCRLLRISIITQRRRLLYRYFVPPRMSTSTRYPRVYVNTRQSSRYM